ncbi:MAG: mechanosensitive ion channel family protein [Oscillospiraceae bacterium]|nr:mechanosensitive ion channel family protein [Oscillospiraceae bacterium]
MDFFTWIGFDAANFVKLFFKAALIVVLTAAMALVVKKLFRKWVGQLEARDRQDHIAFVSVIGYIAKALVYFLGFMALSGLFPSLGKVAASLLAGSGIAAVILGVAAKESAGNLVSGVLIGLFKPFRVGDLVRYLDEDVTGVIEEITIRHTIIRTFENKRLVVPNNIMNSQVIENASYKEDTVCFYLDVDVSYTSDLDRALELMGRTVRGYPGFLDVRTREQKEKGEPDVLLRVMEFKDSGIQLRAYAWAEDVAAAAQAKSDLLRRLKRAFEKEGVELSYPKRLLVTQSAQEAPEIKPR